jgi:putative transcriptional regulator
MGNAFGSQTGKVLLSNASTVTDAFNQTVVLVIQHDGEGAFGLVLNKLTRLSLRDIISNFDDDTQNNVSVFWGGPVDPSFVSILHTHIEMEEQSIEILPGIFLSRHSEVLQKLSQDNEAEFMIYCGYAGWAANQLESEIVRKSWVIHNCKKEFIFSKDPEQLWREALISKGGIYKYFAEHTKDPFLN